jgi:hypothetical protein
MMSVASPRSTGGVGAVALRYDVSDPDAWEPHAVTHEATVLWPAQEASWDRFVVLADPDGRPIVLAKMRSGSRYDVGIFGLILPARLRWM